MLKYRKVVSTTGSYFINLLAKYQFQQITEKVVQHSCNMLKSAILGSPLLRAHCRAIPRNENITKGHWFVVVTEHRRQSTSYDKTKFVSGFYGNKKLAM